MHKECNPEEFTTRYRDLLKHYGMCGEKTQADHPNENGDIEQRHYRFKNALDQTLQERIKDFNFLYNRMNPLTLLAGEKGEQEDLEGNDQKLDAARE